MTGVDSEHVAKVVNERPLRRRKKQIHVTLPYPLIDYVFRAATIRGESVSEVITDLLRRDMEKNEKEHKK